MPYINRSSYKAPFFLKNGHLQTIYRPYFHKVSGVQYHRERIETPDDDFLDLDWSRKGNERILIACHGLEGSTESTYMKSLVKYANESDWDAVGINFRGCSGEPNRQLRTYHSGETEDLGLVVQHVIKSGRYENIALAGFSLGGNVTLKYVGEQGKQIAPEIKAAVGVSVPCHLETSSYALAEWRNKLYMNSFLQTLKEKVKMRWDRLEGIVDRDLVMKSVSFKDFDQHYTAPVFGFKDAKDYWTRSSSLQFLPDVQVPSLLINARDDSFISDRCYPEQLARDSDFFHLEAPKNGGHVAFVAFNNGGYNWIEKRVVNFLSEILNKSL